MHNAKIDFVTGPELFFDLSPDPLCLLATNREIKLTNKNLQEALGYATDKLIATNFLDFVHPADKENSVKALDSINTAGETSLFETRFQYAGNQYKWLAWNAKKMPDETYLLSARDISRYKDTVSQPDTSWIQNHGEAFPESKENYKLLFYSNPLPIVIYDMESLAILDVNQMAAELYGYTRQEFIKLTITDVRPPEDIPLIVESVKNRIYNEKIQNLGIWNHLKKNGDAIKVEVIGHSITYMGRHCWIVVCNDITEQSKTLRSLEQSIERFEYATEATSDIIWDWDLETNEVYYSNNIKKSFGHTPGVNVDDMRFFAKHVHPDDRERVVLYADHIKYGDQKYWTEEYRFRKANGDYAYVLDKGIVIRDDKGIAIRMIGAMQDITELKNNELHISRQKDQLAEIAQINAHEIRRPVATILGLVNLVNKSAIVDPTNLEVLSYLEITTQELDMVIRRIIDKTVD